MTGFRWLLRLLAPSREDFDIATACQSELKEKVAETTERTTRLERAFAELRELNGSVGRGRLPHDQPRP